MEARFLELASMLDRSLQPGEAWTACFAAEDTDFIRFNNGKVRQPGSVHQAHVSIDLIRGRRHATSDLTLSGDPAVDHPQVSATLSELRALVADVPEDPYLLFSTEVRSSSSRRPGRLPAREHVAAAVVDAARGLDLVGIYAAGTICRGFANSFGQRNWHEVENFNFDSSFHHRQDKAVKTAYAGFEWSDADLAARMDKARDHFERLKSPPRTLEPGRYSAYLAPAAIDELLDMMCWGGFSEKQKRVKQSPLQRLYDGNVRLSPLVTMIEDAAGGVAPSFQGEGYIKPDRLPLIAGGEPASTMISPRTAQEYELQQNGADGDEAPASVEVASANREIAR